MNRKPPVPGWKPTTSKEPVPIPTLNGKGIAETLEVEVAAWRNEDGEIFLDAEAQRIKENLKADTMRKSRTLAALRDALHPYRVAPNGQNE